MSSLMVRDVMTKDVVSVRPDTPFRAVVDLLEQHRISAVPVVNHLGFVLGLVSEADLLPKLTRSAGRHDSRWLLGSRRRAARAKATGTVAGDVMTTNLVTATANLSVVAAAERMQRAGVRRLVVTDGPGRLAGIVSRGDLLKLYQRPDAEIRDEVLRALRERSFEPGARLRVDVNAGQVTIVGETPHVSLVAAAVAIAERVPGVVAVSGSPVSRLDGSATVVDRP